MKQIWKFPLGHSRHAIIKMPKEAQILSVQEQFREGVIWAIIDPFKPPEERRFESIETGQKVDLTDAHLYLGTYQVDAGNYVVHVFEIKK